MIQGVKRRVAMTIETFRGNTEFELIMNIGVLWFLMYSATEMIVSLVNYFGKGC